MELGQKYMKRRNYYHQRLFVFLVIVVFVLIQFLTGCNSRDSELDLDATVYYARGDLTIVNNNDFPWSNVKLIINYDENDLSSGYTYEYGEGIGVIRSSLVQSSDFFNSQGDQFRYWDEDPQNLYIEADNALNGEKGSYIKTW